MKIIVNGQPREVENRALPELLDELGYASARVGTALNGEFVPSHQRASTMLSAGDQLEVLAPLQGG